ncbi:hypothetical protein [Rhodocyclus gracilis]|uniref:hypothetical protein n=1 Tax=Rhodocyclus gracilis TaxID=2929842 RepID=UPI001ADBC040|nr:hypothetical protein [Rhodocyclus gracilis]
MGGFGDTLLLACGKELARIDEACSSVLDLAIETHRPKAASWNITEYRRVAREAIEGVTEALPRKTFAVGARVGDRVWSSAAPETTFSVPLVRVYHLLQPLRVGSRVGDRLWGSYSRYSLRVEYYRSVVNPKLLWDALSEFKQAHVKLTFVDITGVAGGVSYEEN